MTSLIRLGAIILASATLVACTQGDQISRDAQPFDGIREDEQLTLVGNEPFWNVEIAGDAAIYTARENMDGTQFVVSRFAGNNGLGFSGELEGEAIQITVTPGVCSDSMSDREYPFTVTITWGDRTLNGCGYTDAQPFTGDAAP